MTAAPGDLPTVDEWRRLSVVPEKQAAFAIDLYFREGWADLRELAGEAAVDTLQRLALLTFKPDAVVARRMTRALGFLAGQGFAPVAMTATRLNRHSMRELWRYNWDTYTLDRLAMSTLLYGAADTGVVLFDDRAPDTRLPATVRLGALKGPGAPEARTEGQLRHLLGAPNRIMNFVHVADEPADVVRELGILHDRPERRALLRKALIRLADETSAAVPEIVARIEASNPAHDLDLDRSLGRLEQRLAASGGAPGLRAAVETGATLGWDELCAIVDPANVDIWDFLCVAVAVLPEERPGRGSLLAAGGVDQWVAVAGQGNGAPLAVQSYAAVERLADGNGVLNLAWTADERPLLAVDLGALIADELRDEAGTGLPWVDSYLVKDPYGEAALGPAVARYFDVDQPAFSVTCGAGVGSLLHGLARLASARTAYVVGDAYPDFPHWVAASGGVCLAGPATGGVDEHAAAAGTAGVPVVFCEHPQLTGGYPQDTADVAALAEAVAATGAVLVVDESNANYHAPRWSAVNLVADGAPLIVVRGLSKGYGLGGLRLAYCVAPPALTATVRSVVPPLLASSLSLRIGRAVLDLGDIGAPLRERVAAATAEATGLLAAAGIAELVSAGAGLPFVLVRNHPGYLRSRLEANGLQGKPHAYWSSEAGRIRRIYRLSAPLDTERMSALRSRLGVEWPHPTAPNPARPA